MLAETVTVCGGHSSSVDHPRPTGVAITASRATQPGYVALIIAYRDHALVERVLVQLAAQTVQPVEVLVVDNGGTLDAETLAAMPLAECTVLVSRPDNPGYGAAVNEARGRLGDRALLVLTHDAQFAPELAERLMGALAADASAGAVGPVLHSGVDRERVFSAGGRLSRGGRASHWADALSAHPYRVDWLDGAIVMLAPTALDAIDWIDEGYFLYFEDVDTGWRLSQQGWRSLVVPQVLAAQQPGAHPVYLGVRNMTLFARRAKIGFLLHLGAVARRVVRTSLGEVRRGRNPRLGDAWRGWRDGRRGVTGPPA